jgi:hypothetical protein
MFQWLNNHLLKMEWLYNLVEKLVGQVFRLNLQDRLGGSIHFFIYDVSKIFYLRRQRYAY